MPLIKNFALAFTHKSLDMQIASDIYAPYFSRRSVLVGDVKKKDPNRDIYQVVMMFFPLPNATDQEFRTGFYP